MLLSLECDVIAPAGMQGLAGFLHCHICVAQSKLWRW